MRQKAKKILFNELENSGWQWVIFNEEAPNKSTGIIECILDAMEKFRKLKIKETIDENIATATFDDCLYTILVKVGKTEEELEFPSYGDFFDAVSAILTKKQYEEFIREDTERIFKVSANKLTKLYKHISEQKK